MNQCKVHNREYRILFTGIGRRVELIQAFKRAAKMLGCNLLIYGADSSQTAPALYYCDYKRIVCRMNKSEYIPQLIELCKRDQIDLLIPTIDTDLLALARDKHLFEAEGIRVLVSAEEKVMICRDKNYTASFFVKCGLKSPLPVNDVREYQAGFPCFIKPKDGSSSINAFRIENESDLQLYSKKIFDYIVQPYIEGKEYTVDIMCDFNGIPIFITPRERLAVRSGEVLKTKIYLNHRIIEECNHIVKTFKPCGPITVQLIHHTEHDENYYIEINPRFGGGAPLSMKAGADSAEAVLRLLMGEKLGWGMEKVRDGAIYSRFDQSVCVNETLDKTEIKAVIFDLDDTLYPEKEYVKSGYQAVARVLPHITDAEHRLWAAFEKGLSAVDTVLEEEGIYSEELKERCLDEYRSHKPDIHLYQSAERVLKNLKKQGIKTGIITDGRPEGQRAKISALGLERLVDEIVVTDELGGIQFRKPNDIAFRIMKEKMKCDFEEMIYIGDNPLKDFKAARQLGMQYLYFRNREGLYSRDIWEENQIESLAEIENSIKYGGGGIKKPEIVRGLLIIGAGGHGAVAADVAEQMKCYSQIGFLDDDSTKTHCGKYKVLGTVAEINRWRMNNDVFVAIGKNRTRSRIQNGLEDEKWKIATLVHPRSVIDNTVIVEKGCVIMAGVVINHGCRIEKGSIVNTASSIDHGSRIGEFCHIAVGSHLSGDVRIDKFTCVGAGTVVKNGIHICGDSVVGAGAAVVKNIEVSGTYAGVPAKRI